MALNREMTMEEKNIREYTESQISRAIRTHCIYR